MADLVLYEVVDRVAVITVNDPDRRNAVTDAMSQQLRDSVGRAEADPGVHAVVVTGAGKAFCAGADLSALGAAAREGLERIYAGFMAVGRCTLPTIAAVNGAAVDMLRTDRSPVIDMLEVMELEFPNVEYVACGISVEYFAEREGRAPPLFGPTKQIYSGVAYMAQLQSEGWGYIKP